jgi:hypothetical protein
VRWRALVDLKFSKIGKTKAAKRGGSEFAEKKRGN